MRKSNAGDWSFLDSILGKGAELGVYTVPGDGDVDFAAVFRELQGLFGLGGAGGRAGPEESAGAALREEGRRPSARGAQRERAGVSRSVACRFRNCWSSPTSPRPTAFACASRPRAPAGAMSASRSGRSARARASPADGRRRRSASSCSPARRARSPAISTAARSASAPMSSPACRGRSMSRPIASSAVEALEDCEVALCSAPAEGRLPPRVIPPGEVESLVRGKGTNARHVRNILPETAAAESLLVVEVITPGGHWSSYPPHKHDRDAAARRDLSRRDLLPPHLAAAGLRLPARLYRRPQPGRDDGGFRRRRRAGAARLSSGRRARMATISTISTPWRARSACGASTTSPRMSG